MDKQLFINYLKSMRDCALLMHDEKSTTTLLKGRLTSEIITINTIIAHIEAGYFDIPIK